MRDAALLRASSAPSAASGGPTIDYAQLKDHQVPACARTLAALNLCARQMTVLFMYLHRFLLAFGSDGLIYWNPICVMYARSPALRSH